MHSGRNGGGPPTPAVVAIAVVVVVTGAGGLVWVSSPAAATGDGVDGGETADHASAESDSTATSRGTANITIEIRDPAPDGPEGSEVVPAGDLDNETGEVVTYSNVEAGRYDFSVYDNRTGAWKGNLSVTVDPGEDKKVTFERYTPYINNTAVLPDAPRDDAEDPRYHVQFDEEVTIIGEVHNPDGRDRNVSLTFTGENSPFPWSMGEITLGAGESERYEFSTLYDAGTRYRVGGRLTAEYGGKSRVTNIDGPRFSPLQTFWIHTEMIDVRTHNWAYDGSRKGSLHGEYLADKGLDGTNTTIALLIDGVDTNSPAFNPVYESGTGWEEGKMNVVYRYNPDIGTKNIDDSPSDGGYHGWQVASAVWQFVPNASYSVYNIEMAGIELKNDIEKSIDHINSNRDPDVIVLSTVYPGEKPTVTGKFSDAVDDNTTVVVAAGNQPDDHNFPKPPSTGEGVLSISSTSPFRERICRAGSPGNSTDFDGDGIADKPDFAAPGCSIVSLGEAKDTTGSSFAAPHAAGAVAQLTQFAKRHGKSASDVRGILRDVAVPTSNWNGSVDEDDNGSTFDDDLDGEGQVMPVGAYHELLADDHVPGVKVDVEQVDATTTSVTFKIRLNETRGADVYSGGVHLAATGGGSFETVDFGDFHSAENVTSGETNVVELYASADNVTSGNITLDVSGNASADVAVRGWLYDQHDAVYDPYRGRYDRYVARYPAENRSVDGDRYAEGETWDRSTGNPPFNRHLGDPGFEFTDYSTIEISFAASPPTSRVDVDPSDLPGNGTAADPYLITNASELQAMQDGLNAHYRLASDIDASGTAEWNDGSGFTPVGKFKDWRRFRGNFNGANHTITGLTILRPDADGVGLFGYTECCGDVETVIRNVSLVDVDIVGSAKVGGLVGRHVGTIANVSVTGSVTGNENVGGLIGETNYATIRTVSASVTVNGSLRVGGIAGFNSASIDTASAVGAVNGSTKTGGLVGRNTEKITRSVSSAEVTGTDETGGLVGQNSGTITRSYSTGEVAGDTEVGGIAGDNTLGTVEKSYAAGPVTGSGQVGGLIGGVFMGTVDHSYWDMTTTGQTASTGGTGLTTAQMTGEAARTNMTGFAFGTVWQTRPDDYPVLIVLSDGTDTATCVADAVSGPDDRISLTEIQTAIDWWARGTEVPDTGGETISLAEIQSLIDAWAEGATGSC